MNNPLDSRQIRAFCVLARTGSFTQTGRELHLTQSSISHSMKALERDVGCRLLDKLGKQVVLTQAGEQLLHHVTRILREMDQARDSLQHLGKWGRGRLRLGASSAACRHLLPPVLLEFKQRFPGHSITVEPGDSSCLVGALLRRRIDLALSPEPDRDPQLEFRRLFTDELKFLVAPEHPWAKTRRVERKEIAQQDYILYSRQSVTCRLIEDYFRRDRIVLNTVIELGSMDAIRELVKLGLGVGIVAPWIAKRELADGSLVALPLGRRKLQRPWAILHGDGKRLDLAEEAIVELCQSATVDARTPAEPVLQLATTVAAPDALERSAGE